MIGAFEHRPRSGCHGVDRSAHALRRCAEQLAAHLTVAGRLLHVARVGTRGQEPGDQRRLVEGDLVDRPCGH
ncbi:MAG: hypothetical protein DLM65_01125 [Candidatus Aeolococcus gillhamiae]|uniref:Uncharacterized protein n=1 Tax=Candidatus Aeolococcus gillhamiae TaxID=3127015 RepID=A0A2W6AET0_9BACT|nr:MAG: hypothetical protein DLM65_01125 [Candidatus Dormibacter sp. RRmetagenome_bin12]